MPKGPSFSVTSPPNAVQILWGFASLGSLVYFCLSFWHFAVCLLKLISGTQLGLEGPDLILDLGAMKDGTALNHFWSSCFSERDVSWDRAVKFPLYVASACLLFSGSHFLDGAEIVLKQGII